MLVEILLAQALRLPNPAQIPIFYSRLLHVMSTLQISLQPAYRAVLAALLARVEEMDVESIETFAELFSLYLVQHKYEWAWGAWVTAPESISEATARFLRRAFDRLLRLAFYENLKHKLPAPLHAFLPAEPTPQPLFDNAAPLEAEHLKSLISVKSPDEDAVVDYLTGLIGTTRRTAEESTTEKWAAESVIALFVHALLAQGAKTPTHQQRLLDTHFRIFATLRPDDPRAAHQYGVAIVRSVFEFWQNSTLRVEISLDALLLREVVESACLTEYILVRQAPGAADNLASWNLLHSVIRKNLERLQTVKSDLAAAVRMDRGDAVEKIRAGLSVAHDETQAVFTAILGALIDQHKAAESPILQRYCLGRFQMVGRKYHFFVRPFLDHLESTLALDELPELRTTLQRFRLIR